MKLGDRFTSGTHHSFPTAIGQRWHRRRDKAVLQIAEGYRTLELVAGARKLTVQIGQV